MFGIGRMCVKVAGREAGKYCVIVKRIDGNFVLVTGPKSVTTVRRRKCNITHLEPLTELLKIKEDASDEEVIKAYEEASLFSKLDLPKPEDGRKAHAPSIEGRERKHTEKAEAPAKKAGKKAE